jgi:zinc protease
LETTIGDIGLWVLYERKLFWISSLKVPPGKGLLLIREEFAVLHVTLVKRLCFVWLALLVLNLLPWQVLPAQAQATVEIQQADLVFEDYVLAVEDYQLENGLRVILAQDQSAPVVAVDIWYRVGGADDPEGRSGFAHLFEHMMFEGSENIPHGQWDNLMESIGAIDNAYTAIDNTGYWSVAPANQLPRLLWMESDRMATLAVTDEAFQTQRAVVIEEYNQRVANRPFGAANLRLFKQPLMGYPPYERDVIGNVEELTAATLEEVQAFHAQYYQPNNATLVIVGDIEIEQTQALVEAYFGAIPAGEEVTPILSRYPFPDELPVTRVDEASGCAIGSEEVLIDPKIQIPRLGVTVLGPQRGEPDYYALELLAYILSGGDSSRIEQNIVQEGLAASAFAGYLGYLGASIFYAAALPNSGDPVEDMFPLLYEEFLALRTEPVTQEELARAKRQLLVEALTSYRESVRETAEWLQDYALAFDDPMAILDELAMYEAVTAEDIQQVAQKYLCEQPMHFQLVLTEGEEQLAPYPGVLVEPVEVEATEGTAQRPARLLLKVDEEAIAALPEGVVTRTEVPAPLGELTSNFPPFETFTLDNGLEVIFVEQHKVPKIRLQLVVGGANAAASPDKQGVANFLAELITKGTRTRSAAQIAAMIEDVGGSISASAGLEWISLSVEALASDARLGYTLLSDMARNATLPQREFDVVKNQTLTMLEQDAVNPSSMADRQFARVAFGGHPYGYIRTPETVRNLTREDVAEFYRTFWRPNNALLVVVGDMSAEEARRETERAFRFWRAGEVPDFLDYPVAEEGDRSKIYLVDRPTSEQATIQVGNLAINARNPDRYALEVVNAVLGSGSSSRLYQNLRQDKGYTYGVQSRFARPNDRASFRVLGDFSQANAGDAIREIINELERIRTEPISDQEIEDVKGRMTGNFALSLEDPANFAIQLAVRRLTGVEIEELNEYLVRLQRVTVEEAQAAAYQYIDTENPIIIVVGNAALLRPQLEELADVVVVDNDGNVIEESTSE